MICTCGGTTKETRHQVKGLKKAQEWYGKITLLDLPITVEQQTCISCGRSQRKIWDSDARLIVTIG